MIQSCTVQMYNVFVFWLYNCMRACLYSGAMEIITRIVSRLQSVCCNHSFCLKPILSIMLSSKTSSFHCKYSFKGWEWNITSLKIKSPFFFNIKCLHAVKALFLIDKSKAAHFYYNIKLVKLHLDLNTPFYYSSSLHYITYAHIHCTPHI